MTASFRHKSLDFAVSTFGGGEARGLVATTKFSEAFYLSAHTLRVGDTSFRSGETERQKDKSREREKENWLKRTFVCSVNSRFCSLSPRLPIFFGPRFNCLFPPRKKKKETNSKSNMIVPFFSHEPRRERVERPFAE